MKYRYELALIGRIASQFELRIVQCRISPPPHRRCAYAHILKTRSLSLDASRHNSSFARVWFVLCAKLLACHIRTSHTKDSLALSAHSRAALRASLVSVVQKPCSSQVICTGFAKKKSPRGTFVKLG